LKDLNPSESQSWTHVNPSLIIFAHFTPTT
jgi:hypothetical protein